MLSGDIGSASQNIWADSNGFDPVLTGPEFGIPCIVGIGNATEALTTGQEVNFKWNATCSLTRRLFKHAKETA